MPFHRARTSSTAKGPADRFDDASAPAMRVVDVSLAACLFVVPFLMAGRHPVGQAVVIALCLFAAVAWTNGQAVHVRAPF